NEKVEFDLNITFDAAYQVIANGKLVATSNEEPKSIMWSFDMQKPMSSYLLAFAIGNYDKKTIASASGIPIELYYYPQDSLRVEPTYRHTKTMFDFLETEIGLRYPWQNYKQIPVKDFLYSGMENTTATIFSDAYVIDTTAFIDKNYVNVNAHELAHQWFGNLVTATNGNHHWLQEGFATYYALLAEKEVFGDDYFYWKLHKTAEQLQSMSEDNKGEALTDAKASSLTFYEKGAWALVALRNQLGENAFKTGIKNYLETYKFKNVTIQNFLAEMEQASGKNLGTFESVWLSNTNFPTIEAKTYLKNNSESLAAYFELQEKLENTTDKAEKLNFITEIYGKTNSTTLKSALISKYFTLLPEEFIKNVFLSNEIELRQAIILATDSIPETLKSDYETLLDDKSYLTLESALYKLWASFPEDQKKYLDATDGVVGLPNKNIRLLWLTLAIASQNYNGLKTKEYFDELTSYTNPKYGTETRQTAFTYLYQTLGLTDANLKDLADASVHHSWQFKKFARNLIDELVKDADYKNRIKELVLTLNIEEQRYIKSKL
ncbi:MAG: M1 family metallopeptidase, partial [Cellulophaga sp.]|nr:M1 family metallopeptidase [Cellulophaga sp.]